MQFFYPPHRDFIALSLLGVLSVSVFLQLFLFVFSGVVGIHQHFMKTPTQFLHNSVGKSGRYLLASKVRKNTFRLNSLSAYVVKADRVFPNVILWMVGEGVFV